MSEWIAVIMTLLVGVLLTVLVGKRDSKRFDKEEKKLVDKKDEAKKNVEKTTDDLLKLIDKYKRIRKRDK